MKFALKLPALCLPILAAATALAAQGQHARHRVYSQRTNPREHPDDSRRYVRPPDWTTFGERVHFTALRDFPQKDGKLVGFREQIEKYTRTYDLGDVIWPSYPVLFASNLEDLAREIRDQKLFLFDIWGYVPGSGPGGYWQQFEPPPGVFPMLDSILGERWLGMDVGEQDGRYIGSYAPEMFPPGAGRFEQYVNFHRHFERMTTDLGSRMSTLVSLNFGHYFLKEGIYTLIGAETAQGLPNGQVYYAFIRGAGKQYGVPWFGNASVWNRWGWKAYGDQGEDHGPTKGTSLSLLKRLMYSHILYNSVFAGFESSWFDGEQLSPVGKIQQSANRWTREHADLGVMMTPVALLLDSYSGWSFPRHLYSDDVYRVWGNLPYEAGDYLTDGVLNLLYPGYQNSSYFHDESGFIAATPFGDSADVLLSDTPGWLLNRYPLVVVAGELSGGAEVRDKLQAFAESGGRLILTAGNLVKMAGGVGGITATGVPVRIDAGQQITVGTRQVAESEAFDVISLALPAGAKVLARAGARVLAAELACGKGSVTVLASTFGIPASSVVAAPIKSEIDRPLAKPFPLLRHVSSLLEQAFREQQLFDAGDGLALIVCRKAPGEYTIGITNNSWTDRPFHIVSRCGRIGSVEELPLDVSEKNAQGYRPESVSANSGQSPPATIAGGDVRIFSVQVHEENVEVIPHVPPPPRPQGRILAVRGIRSIQEEVLRRPEFFQHFDGVTVDWTYLRDRDRAAIERESSWIRQQKLRILVDLTSGVNLYPDLRLIDNLDSDYAASLHSIEGVLSKMQLLGSRDLILSLHRFPENNFTDEQTWAAFEKTLRQVSKRAAELEITLYLRLAPEKPPDNDAEAAKFLARVGAPNLKFAASTAVSHARESAPALIPGLWLMSASSHDIGGAVWNRNAPVDGSGEEKKVLGLLNAGPKVPIVFDAVYPSLDEEYRDVRLVERSMR
jgi:hypothetical protein